MKKIHHSLAFISIYFFSMTGAFGQDFTHPGIFNSQKELDAMRINVWRSDHRNSSDHPMKEGWWKQLNKAGGITSNYVHSATPIVIVEGGYPPPQTEADFRDDGFAVYALALKWVVTGDQAYANKAIEILNAWSSIFQKLQSNIIGARQVELEAGWFSMPWIASAEIIRHYDGGAAGWSANSITQFSTTIAEKLYLYCDGMKVRNTSTVPNQALITSAAKLSIAIFQDNRSRYDAAKAELESLFSTSFNAGGVNREFSRDAGHAHYVVACCILAAEIDWHQDGGLYDLKHSGESMPILWNGLETISRLSLSDTINISYTGGYFTPPSAQELLLFPQRSEGQSTWEMAVNHYENRAEIKLPKTMEIAQANRTLNVEGDSHFLKWGILTHANLSKTNESANVLMYFNVF